jgi:hypothetical protein
MTSRATSVARHSVIAGALVVGMMLCMTCRKPNRAPSMPDAPDGPSSGAKDSLCEFTSTATDPNGGDVCFRFDWGDGDTSDWTGWVKSGQPGGASHAWHSSGTFAVRAQAKDPGDSVSAWSDVHQLSVAMSWRRTFGRSFGDWGNSVEQTSDGGYIFTGLTCPEIASNPHVWLVKVDSSGEKTWDVTFGKAAIEGGNSVRQTTDGGYIVVGYTFSYGAGSRDVWLIKTDASGNKVWDRTYGGTAEDDGRSVAQTLDGGYIVAGATCSFGAGVVDVWLIKTDENGDTLWTRTFGGVGDDEGASVQPTADGGYIVAGSSGQNLWLIKTDASGNRIWDVAYGGAGEEEGASVQQTSDGGYIATGYATPDGPGVWLVKADSSGNRVWDKTYGSAGTGYGASVRQTTDGGYIITGTYEGGDVWLVKTFGGDWTDEGKSVAQTSDGGYIVVGYAFSFGDGAAYVYLIKTGANGE